MSMDDDSEATASQLAKLMAAEVERVYNSKAMPSLNKSITHAYASIFANAIEKGYGVNFDELDYNSTDFNAITNLINSAYQFAAAKNYTQLRQLTTALVDDQKKLRSFSEFKKVAYTITDAHNNQWLKTEYNTAIASAQMGSKWQDIQANRHTLPLLQMDVIVDAQTSDICKPLEGIIKPIDDPFWATYYPPNHFACRTIVRQLAKGKITPDNEIVHPEKVPPMFKTNLAQNGMLFPKDHPYFIGVPKEIIKQNMSILPRNLQFEQIFATEKGKVLQHFLVDKTTEDYNDILTIAKELAQEGDIIEINPKLHEKDPLRTVIYPDAKPKKNPDIRRNNELVEIESPKIPLKRRAIVNRINKGAEQADSVLLNLNEEFNKTQLLEIITKRFEENETLKTIIVRIMGSYFHYQKP